MGSYSVAQCLRRLVGQPLCCSAVAVGLWGEGLWWWLHPLRVTQHCRLASLAAWPSSTGISHYNLLPHTPSVCLSTVNSSLCLGIAPQSLSSRSQLLRLPGDLPPVWGMYHCGKDCLILIPFRLPQMSCFTLSLKCFSSDSDSCPNVGIRALLQFLPAEGRSSPTNAPVSPPSSFVLLSFAWFYMFFSTGQVLLSALGWCSAWGSVSGGVFLMHPLGEMCSTSTYSSAILFSLIHSQYWWYR